MSLDSYDWSEGQIRHMVEKNHVPEEVIDYGPENAVEARVICAECHQNWPCDILKGLRAYLTRRRSEGTNTNDECPRCGHLGWPVGKRY